MNLRVKSVFLLLCLEGTLVGWSQELPAMATDVNTVSATGLEIRLPGPQGVAASEGLFGSHFGDGASSVSRTVVASSPAAKAEVMDKRYYFLNGLHLGMAVFDVEMTQRCISEQKCREANPVMPSSQAGQLSINFVLVGCEAWYSYWLKKHHPKVWWIAPLSGSVVHAAGVATGFEHQ
jgi:hypothetical protein